MVSLDEAIVARFGHGVTHFEVLVDPKSVMLLREGKETDVLKHLAIDTVFKDSRKGDHATSEMIMKAFGTTDIATVALKIIKDGEVQLTTDQRRQMLEQKRKQIVTDIARSAWNPQTKTPHPPGRIEKAMEEAKVHIDPFKPTDVQVNEVLKAIKPLIPISMERVQIAFKIPALYAGKGYAEVRKLGDLARESWQNDGSFLGVIELPAGMQSEILDHLNHLTKGSVETKLLK
jgi:ribosome maturation protein SDO1